MPVASFIDLSIKYEIFSFFLEKLLGRKPTDLKTYIKQTLLS